MLAYAPPRRCPWPSPPPQLRERPIHPTKFTVAVIPPANPTVLSLNTFKAKAGARDATCNARRRLRYESSGGNDDEDEEHGPNMEIAMLESYTESRRDEVLLVRAMVDQQEEVVLIFRGFSSSLSLKTSSDPSRSVLPTRAVIKFIDRIKGPFNPNNVEYIEEDLSWEAFKLRLKADE